MSRALYRRLRNSLISRLTPLLSLLLAGSSWKRAQRNGRFLGRVAWTFALRDRVRALTHLRMAFPELEQTAIETIARDCFEHFGTSLGEFLYLSRNGVEEASKQFDLSGWQHVEAAQREERGVLIATGHCGNWELLGPAFRSRDTPLAAIVRSFDETGVDDLAVRFRERLGTESIRRGEKSSARQLLRIFRGQGNLLVLIDHDIRAESVWVPFFGHLAHTAVGPAQMALRHSLIVIPAFCERRQDGRHAIRFLPPVELPSDETEATAALTRPVEDQIRRCPAQWTWMHRRWRRRPEGEAVDR